MEFPYGYVIAGIILFIAFLMWFVSSFMQMGASDTEARRDEVRDAKVWFFWGVASLVACLIFDGIGYSAIVDFCRAHGCEFSPLR